MSILMQQMAVQYLFVAIRELFPKAVLMNGEGTFRCFYCDVRFPFSFQEEILPLIEERMRRILRENPSIRIFEMVPSNAATLLRRQEQREWARRIEAFPASTVQMSQIKEMVNPSSFEEDPSEHLFNFKLLEGFNLPIGGLVVTRLVGAVSEDKKILKALVKGEKPSQRDHRKILNTLGWLHLVNEQGLWMWLPQGEKVKQRLISWWEKEHLAQGFSRISSPALFLEGGVEEGLLKCHRECFAVTSQNKTAELCQVPSSEDSDVLEGLFLTGSSFTDRAYVHCLQEKLLEEVTSSLQFILKIPKILSFEFELSLSVSDVEDKKGRQEAVALFKAVLKKLGFPFSVGKIHERGVYARIDVLICDALGRRWRGPFLGLSVKEGLPVLIRSAFGSMERLVGLILERTQGEIPF